MSERPNFKTYQEYMIWRLDKRVETVRAKAERIKENYIKRLPSTDGGSEENRIWLDQFARGVGFDIACGDFLIGDVVQALGVDGAPKMLGTDYWSEGDDLSFQPADSLDYIVTNYLDGMPAPLKALVEWRRCIKSGGRIAVVCRDAEQYTQEMGPLENARRQSCYTEVTLKNYLYRVGFIDVRVEVHPKSSSLRGSATK